MASAHATTRSILSSFLPRLSPPTASSTSRFTIVYSRQLSLPLLPSLGVAIPSAIQLNVPGLVEGLWESILRAVPKKKTSHSKKRSRQYAGKALKDVTALNKCSACGNIKRAHLLCPYCVNEIKNMFAEDWNALPREKAFRSELQQAYLEAQIKHKKEEAEKFGRDVKKEDEAAAEQPSDAKA